MLMHSTAMPPTTRPGVDPAPSGARIGWWLLCTVLAVFLTCLHLTTTKPFDLTTLQQLVHFWAVEPFQHRVLLPATVAGIKLLLPLQTRLVFAVLEIGFWIALMQLAYAALIQFDIGRQPLDRRLLALSLLVPMAMHLMVPDLQLNHGFTVEDGTLGLGEWDTRSIFYYVYDLPAAVFTLALTLLLLRLEHAPNRTSLWTLYLAVFAVATVNRETTLFMLPATAIVFWWSRPRRVGLMVALLAAQAMLFVAIQWPLQWLFAINDNPAANVQVDGLQYEHHLIENLRVLSHPLYLITYLVRFTAGCYIPLLMLRRYLNARLGRVLLGFALPLGATAFVMGRLVEHRIFIEIVPLIWLGALQAISRYRQNPYRERPPRGTTTNRTAAIATGAHDSA